MSPYVSIVIPTLNESAAINDALQSLQTLRQAGHEVIVVDGDSSDDSGELARPLADHVIQSPPGRARQMNAGARQARHEVLLFLHADTRLPPTAIGDIGRALAAGYVWGRFDVRIIPENGLLKVVALLMNLRSRLTGIATGDQAIFVESHLFAALGGYPDMRLMEDLALSDRLKQYGRPARIKSQVTTSARRWRQHGYLKTIVKMWSLRLAFRLGVAPDKLARFYE